MTLRRLGAAIAAAAVAPFATVADAAQDRSYEVAGWTITPHYGGAGEFHACSMEAVYNSGVSLGFVSRGWNGYSIYLSKEDWALPESGAFPLRLSVDHKYPRDVAGVVLDSQSIIIDFDGFDDLYQRFRLGRQAQIEAASETFRFNLDGTAKGLDAMLDCARRRAPRRDVNPFGAQTARAAELFAPPRSAEPPRAAPASTPAAASPPSGRDDARPFSSEAEDMAEEIFAEAGLRDVEYWSGDDADDVKPGVIWSAPPIYGYFVVDAESESLPETTATIVAMEMADCEGKFAFGRNSSPEAEDEAYLFAACEGLEGPRSTYFAVLPRAAGGYYVLSVQSTEESGVEGEDAAATLHGDVRRAAAALREGTP